MAEGNSVAPQRSFAKNIKGQSAAQIRQSTTATVKALTEQVRVLLNSYDKLAK